MNSASPLSSIAPKEAWWLPHASSHLSVRLSFEHHFTHFLHVFLLHLPFCSETIHSTARFLDVFERQPRWRKDRPNSGYKAITYKFPRHFRTVWGGPLSRHRVTGTEKRFAAGRCDVRWASRRWPTRLAHFLLMGGSHEVCGLLPYHFWFAGFAFTRCVAKVVGFGDGYREAPIRGKAPLRCKAHVTRSSLAMMPPELHLYFKPLARIFSAPLSCRPFRIPCIYRSHHTFSV